MESDRLHESLVHELNKGKELAKDLAKQLRETSSSNNSERLVENVLSSYNEALLILSGRTTQVQCQTVISDPPSSSISLCNVTQSKDSSSGSLERKYGDDGQTIVEGAPDEDEFIFFSKATQSKYSSSSSLERKHKDHGQTIIERAHDEDQSLISLSSDPPGSSITLCNVTQSKDSSRSWLKRKSRLDIRTVKINEKVDDGYCWRKYGQKEILGSKYPRSYYRCVFRHAQGCLATKQEQKSDEDPTVSHVTYAGVHTCLNKPGITGERSPIP